MIALALVLATALGATEAPPDSPDPAASPTATSASEPSPTLGGDETPDAEVMGFLSLSESTASRDGGVKLPWEGPGGAQLRLSWDALDKRNEQLAMGDMMARALVETVRMFFENDGGLDPDGMRTKLMSLTGAPMDEAREAYLDAVNWEERRLFFVERAVAQAQAEGVQLPGVDPALIARRAQAIRSGAVKKAVAAKVDGYRNLAGGLVDYLEGDNFRALEKVRKAAGALPEFAVAHALLGSMYFLFDQKEAAVTAWRRSYELDPSNEAVKEALLEYGRSTKKHAPERR